jgi:hypothetical protein
MSFLKNFFGTVVLFFICICSLSTLDAMDVFDLTQITTLPDGSMVAVWQDNVDGQFTICSSTYTTSWSVPAVISVTGESSFYPKMYMNDSGNIVVGWQAVDTTNGTYVLKAATKLAGASWGTPALLSNPDNQIQNTFQFKVDDLGANGNAVAIWSEIDPSTGDYSIWSETTPFEGSWGTAAQIQ